MSTTSVQGTNPDLQGSNFSQNNESVASHVLTNVKLVFERVKDAGQYVQANPKKVLKNTSLGVGVSGSALGVVLLPLGATAAGGVAIGFGTLGLTVYQAVNSDKDSS